MGRYLKWKLVVSLESQFVCWYFAGENMWRSAFLKWSHCEMMFYKSKNVKGCMMKASSLMTQMYWFTYMDCWTPFVDSIETHQKSSDGMLLSSWHFCGLGPTGRLISADTHSHRVLLRHTHMLRQKMLWSKIHRTHDLLFIVRGTPKNFPWYPWRSHPSDLSSISWGLSITPRPCHHCWFIFAILILLN